MPYKEPKQPCPCFICNGQMRQKRTVATHAHYEAAARIQIDSTSVFPIDIEMGRDIDWDDTDDYRDDQGRPRLRRITSDTRDLLQAYDLYFAKEDDMDKVLWEEDDNAPTLGILITMHLDWISTFRVSDVSAGHVWATMRSLLNGSGDPGNPLAGTTYTRILKFVAKHKLNTVEKIPVCPCGEVIYYDFTDPQILEIYKYCSATERDSCARCGLTKCVPGTQVPRQVIYYISPEVWLKDLYQRGDLAHLLRNDVDPATFSTGSVRRSEGYRQKVTDNPRMNSDPRHAPIVGHADGGPYFKDLNGGGAWFFILRHACLPEAILLDQSLAHMPLIIPNARWEDNEIEDSPTKERDGIYVKKQGYDHHHALQTGKFILCNLYAAFMLLFSLSKL
jgi:hypothetical protein